MPARSLHINFGKFSPPPGLLSAIRKLEADQPDLMVEIEYSSDTVVPVAYYIGRPSMRAIGIHEISAIIEDTVAGKFR